MSLLSDSESSGDEKKVVERLKINEKFADRFEKSERVKDLHRAKEFLKNADAGDDDEESDSESETEDEDAEQLSLGLDLKIIQTINSLRKKDPKIYDPNAKWFDAPEESSSDEDAAKTKGSSKKKKYKDILREQLLESEAAGGLGDGDGIETSARGVRDTASRSTLVYDAEQEKIRQAFLKSAGNAGEDSSDSDDDEDNVLRVKRKSAQEAKAEALELQLAMKEMRELAAKNAKAEEGKKSKDKSKTVVLESDVEEGFLENYLEKQLWKDKESTQRRRRDAAEESEEENLDEDEAELDQVDRFESKYNFRFEELQDEKSRLGGAGSGGMVEVTGHARDVQGSMRRADEKRKTQRESRKERKEKERRQQEAELRRLKNLKRQELRERLQQIGKMSGMGDLGLDEEDDELAEDGDAEGAGDEVTASKKKSRKGGKRARSNKLKLNEDFLDEDWDPEKHEALMAAQFGDDYYGEEDEDFNVADLDDEDAYARYLAGDDGLGDVDYGEEDGAYEADAGAARAELRKTAAAMEDELYQLDYEDIVAGLPCRFKYKQVEKEGFGLTAEDILLADDSELNKYVSLKKISAYTHHSGVQEAELSKKRKRLRENVKERLAQQAEDAQKAGQQLKGTKPKTKAAAEAEDEEGDADAGAAGGEEQEGKRRKRKRRKGANSAPEPVELISKNTVGAAPGRSSKDTGKSSASSAPAAVQDSREAGSSSKDKDGKEKEKEKKKSKKSGSRKKEETVQEKRMNLYK